MGAMSIMEFESEDLAGVEPLSFSIAGQTFRVPRKVPLEGVGLLASVMINDAGQRIYAAARLLPTLIAMVCDEEYVDGAWRPADDRARFRALVESPRVNIRIETYGKLALWIVEELTALPSGAPKP